MSSTHKQSPTRLAILPLTPTAFSPFGTISSNPAHTPSSDWPSRPAATPANQGTATKHTHVSALTSSYPSPATPQLNLFVCRPRPLTSALNPTTTTLPYPGTTKTLSVPVLERHPFTTQTFVPLGLDAADRDTAYIVVVAPTLASAPPAQLLSSRLRGLLWRQQESPAAHAPLTQGLFEPRGTGGPDLARARAFVAHGGQAVTYAPGTWHAPMIVVGQKEVEFVVVQYASGVAEEDCHEVQVGDIVEGGGQLEVVVEEGVFGLRTGAGGGVRAKL